MELDVRFSIRRSVDLLLEVNAVAEMDLQGNNT